MHLTVTRALANLAPVVVIALRIGHVAWVHAIFGRTWMPRLRSLLAQLAGLSCERLCQGLSIEYHVFSDTGRLVGKSGVSARCRVQLTFRQSCLLSRTQRHA